jgi:DNA-binding ferritin-like protein (Dps family)
MTMWIEKLTGSLEQKRQYKQYRARIEALPEPYRSAAKALQRYFMNNAGMVDPDTVLKM